MTPQREEARPSVFADGMRALRDDPLRRLVAFYLLTLIVLLPLPFGGWRDWTVTLVALCTAACLLAVAVAVLAGRARLGRLSIVAVPAALYALALIWAALQTSDLPFLQSLWHPIWGNASEALGVPVRGSISLDRFETWRKIISLGNYAGILMLGLYAITDLRVARMMVRALVYAGAAYALYGLVVEFTGAGVTLWYEKSERFRDVLSSTFRNRNNFAAYSGMALIVATGLFLNEMSDSRNKRTREAAIVTADRIWRNAWPMIVCAIIIATALLLTQSRAGLVATVFGIAVLSGIVFLTPRVRPLRPRTMLLIGVVMFGLLLALSGGRTTERIVVGLDADDERFLVIPAVIQGIHDFLWTGTGLGSFEDIHRLYRNSGVDTIFMQAHNDALELVLDLGLPAAAAILLALAWIVCLCLRELRARRRGAIMPCIAVAVTVQLGLHSMVDFSMQVPAVMVSYMILLVCGLTRSGSDDGESRR